MFQNRKDAGRRLAERLQSFKKDKPVVVALPRGGVPVGFEVARSLEAPLDILIVRKLCYPGQSEFAIGAIADGGQWETVFNNEMVGKSDLPPGYLDREIAAKREEIRHMEKTFRSHRPAIQITDRAVLVVDDGIATGATVCVVIRRLQRESPLKIIVASPVASREAVKLLKKEADEVICLETPSDFRAVGEHYLDFLPVSDDEVKFLLDGARQFAHAPHTVVKFF